MIKPLRNQRLYFLLKLRSQLTASFSFLKNSCGTSGLVNDLKKLSIRRVRNESMIYARAIVFSGEMFFLETSFAFFVIFQFPLKSISLRNFLFLVSVLITRKLSKASSSSITEPGLILNTRKPLESIQISAVLVCCFSPNMIIQRKVRRICYSKTVN